MTVQDLINQLLKECELYGKDPAETPVNIDFGAEYAEVETVNSYGGNDYPFTVVLY